MSAQGAAKGLPANRRQNNFYPPTACNQSRSRDNHAIFRAFSGRLLAGRARGRRSHRPGASAPTASSSVAMRILVTGASGFAGSLLVPRLLSAGHAVRALGRDPARVSAALAGRRSRTAVPRHRGHEVEVLRGDALSGDGLARAVAGVDVAYYLIHSMERPAPRRFRRCELVRRARSSRRAQLRRRVRTRGRRSGSFTSAGSIPRDRAASRHLASREYGRADPARRRPRLARPARLDRDRRALALVSLSRPSRRAPAGPHPARMALLSHTADRRARRDRDARRGGDAPPRSAGRSLDIGGPDVLTYGEMISRIAELMSCGVRCSASV